MLEMNFGKSVGARAYTGICNNRMPFVGVQLALTNQQFNQPAATKTLKFAYSFLIKCVLFVFEPTIE